MASYTRQSTFADGDTITAALFNDEFNQLVNAFNASTGHKHDGTAGEGPVIDQIGDSGNTPVNRVLVDTTNNYIEFWIDVSSTSTQQLYIADGAIVPTTDNDIDLGTSSLEFKDLYIDGTANIDSLVLGSGATVTAILDEDTLSSDSATALATQQSIKAYVDSQVTAQDLDLTSDSGTIAIDLDSETLTIGGTSNEIETSATGNAVTIGIPAAAEITTSLGVGGGSTNGVQISQGAIAIKNGGTQSNIDFYCESSNAHYARLQAPAHSAFSGNVTLTLPAATGTLVGSGDSGTVSNTMLANSTVSFGGISLALGASDATPAFDLSDATNYPTSSLSGTISNAQLANSTVSFGGVSLALGASDATPAFDLTDATNYPTSSLTGTITNAQLAGSIANSKLANSSITVTDGSNSTATALGGTITFAGTSNEVEVAESSGTITYGLPNDVTISNNLTVSGNLTDSGTTTQTGPIVSDDNFTGLTNANTGNSTDFGLYGKYVESSTTKYAGLFYDASTDNTFRLFTDTQTEPASTVDTSATGYAAANLVVNNLTGTIATAAQTNITSVGALDGGSITSGFGSIDNGSSAITTTGTITYGSLSDGTITITGFVDEDDMSSDSATLIPTQQSVKAYVDTNIQSADTLAELTDTNITTPADGALLFYDTGTSKWIDNVVSGDITIADTGVAAIGSGVIVNADINASAAISVSKTALTAGTGLTLSTDTLSVDASQTQITAVGALNAGSITSGFGSIDVGSSAITTTGTVTGGTLAGTLSTAAQTNVTSLGTLTTLTVDNVIINGTTIGHTSDTDLMTLASGVLTVAGEVDATSLDISGDIDVDGTANLDNTDIDGTLNTSGVVTCQTSANISQVAITSSSNSIAWDAAAAANAYYATTENTTFAAPSNATEGAIISVEIAQGSTAYTVAWNTVFEFAASTAPTVTATANKTDIFTFRYNGSVWQEIGRTQNLAQT